MKAVFQASLRPHPARCVVNCFFHLKLEACLLRVVFPEPVEVVPWMLKTWLDLSEASLEDAIALRLLGIAVRRQLLVQERVSVRPWHHHLGTEKAGKERE